MSLQRLHNYWDAAVVNNIAGVESKIRALCTHLATATAVSVAQEWSDATSTVVRLALTGGHEICFATSITTDLNVGNTFLGAARGNDELMVSFCPNGSYGTIDGSNNPWALATFCSDVSAHPFMWIDLTTGNTLYYAEAVTWIAQADTNTLRLLVLGENSLKYCPYYQYLVCDADAFSALTLAGDTDGTLLMRLPVSQLTATQTILDHTLGESGTQTAIAFRCVGTAADDGFYEDGSLFVVQTNLTNIIAGTAGSPTNYEAGKENRRVVDVMSASITGGDKGTLRSDILSVCRPSAGWLEPGGTSKHLWRGQCIGIASSGTQLG